MVQSQALFKNRKTYQKISNELAATGRLLHGYGYNATHYRTTAPSGLRPRSRRSSMPPHGPKNQTRRTEVACCNRTYSDRRHEVFGRLGLVIRTDMFLFHPVRVSPNLCTRC